jgi:hypothetical protein
VNDAPSTILVRTVWMVSVALMLSGAAGAVASTLAGANSPAPTLNVTPNGNLTDGQTISVSVGSNGFFTPHARVNILECADPGGLAANLPRDDTTCDGNTIQGSTILVGGDGSFSYSHYSVYLLPSSTLGEQANAKPVCNESNYCVLFVGQNQNDFTAPKVFSAPFLIAPSSGSTPASTGAGSNGSTATTNASGAQAPTTSPAAAGTAAPSAAVSAPGASAAADSSGSLANTGSPAQAEWVALSGLALLLGGTVGRRCVSRVAR